ncbi:hypothetical protein ECP029943810_0819 [Escherichia coli P0299438.10]|nr:hypothetical protein ECP029943810_0819 [Escherichia coli P0299438.10]
MAVVTKIMSQPIVVMVISVFTPLMLKEREFLRFWQWWKCQATGSAESFIRATS